MNSSKTRFFSGVVSCFSCGALVPDIDGPVHRIVDSSAGCWAIFGEVLAREYYVFEQLFYGFASNLPSTGLEQRIGRM